MAKESSLRSMAWNREHQSLVNMRIAEIKKKNPEKYKELNDAWREKNKDKRAIYIAEYRGKNKERVAQWAKNSNEKHKEEIRVRQKAYVAELRREVLSHYSGGDMQCACCGEKIDEFLTIDHVGGGGAEHRRLGLRGVAFYLWLKRNEYPDGFRVLCMNCNFSIGIKGYCPHQKAPVDGEE